MLPVNHSLESRYFERMARGMTAKSELVFLARPGSVLNVGAGGPELSSEFEAAGHSTISIDAAPEACERLNAAGLRFIEGNAEDLQDIVDEPVDNVVFSSVLHEVFSYAEGDGRDAIRGVLKSAFNVLRPGGWILIRDSGSFSKDDFYLRMSKWVRKNHVRTSDDWRRRRDFGLNSYS